MLEQLVAQQIAYGEAARPYVYGETILAGMVLVGRVTKFNGAMTVNIIFELLNVVAPTNKDTDPFYISEGTSFWISDTGKLSPVAFNRPILRRDVRYPTRAELDTHRRTPSV